MKSMISCVRLKGCNRWEGVSWFVVVVIFCLPVKRITEIKTKNIIVKIFTEKMISPTEIKYTKR